MAFVVVVGLIRTIDNVLSWPKWRYQVSNTQIWRDQHEVKDRPRMYSTHPAESSGG